MSSGRYHWRRYFSAVAAKPKPLWAEATEIIAQVTD